MTVHADFAAAPAAHQWTKPLGDLFEYLRERAWKLKGGEAWVILPHGALVALRVGDDFAKRVRIARREPPKDEAALHKWSAELDVFRKHLGITAWRIERHTEDGKAEVVYRESFATEQTYPKCVYCGGRAEKGPFPQPVCTKCAIEKGNEDIEARRRAHTEAG